MNDSTWLSRQLFAGAGLMARMEVSDVEDGSVRGRLSSVGYLGIECSLMPVRHNLLFFLHFSQELGVGTPLNYLAWRVMVIP